MAQELSFTERLGIARRLGESHFREFKSALDRSHGTVKPRPVGCILRDIGDTLVGFANADGGELLIGVEDDGTVTGIPHDAEDVEKMTRAPQTHVLGETPLANTRVYAGRLRDQPDRILYFSVAKGTQTIHLTSDGRCLQRYDLETRPVAIERIQFERQESRSREFDRQFVDGATTADLDLDLLRQSAQQLLSGASPEKVLQYLGLAEYAPGGLRLRKGVLLLFGKEVSRWHPRCEVRVMRVLGTSVGVGSEYNVDREDIVRGNILAILRGAWDVLRPHLARQKPGAGGLFREIIIYPEQACMEALINAVAHRDYSMEGRPIEVFVFDDRLEVRSPGGLLSTITIEQLRSFSNVHQSRNAYIARVLRELNYMRELGEGIPRIFRLMEEHDLAEPEIASDSETFAITLYQRSVFSPRDQEWLESYKDFQLSRDEQRVLLLGRDGHPLSQREIRTTLNIVDTEDYRKLLVRLTRKGLIYSLISSHEVTGVARRLRRERADVGRFLLRSVAEVELYHGELASLLQELPQTDQLTANNLRWIQLRLSDGNPYGGEGRTSRLVESLTYLAYIDEDRRPLHRIKELWGAKR